MQTVSEHYGKSVGVLSDLEVMNGQRERASCARFRIGPE